MTAGKDTSSDLVVKGSVAFKERSLTAEFKLRAKSGEERIVKYTERKDDSNTIDHIGLEIDLGDGLAGNIFKVGSANSVGTVFAKKKAISLPFAKSLGDVIMDQYGQELVEAFTDFLDREGYSFAKLLWADALRITGDGG